MIRLLCLYVYLLVVFSFSSSIIVSFSVNDVRCTINALYFLNIYLSHCVWLFIWEKFSVTKLFGDLMIALLKSDEGLCICSIICRVLGFQSFFSVKLK